MPFIPQRPFYQRMLLAGGRGIVALPLLADALARPAYLPLLRVLSRLPILQRLELWVAAQPRWLILIVLAVPFLGVEPLKVVGLVWISDGRFLHGVALLAFAYGASFVLVERIYRAGRGKLRTYRWLAACIDFVVGIRDAVLARLRATWAWRMAKRTAQAATEFVSTALRWLRTRSQRGKRPH